MRIVYRPTQKRWETIQDDNIQFDDDLFYGVTITKVFYHPSHPFRTPNKDYVLISRTAQEALALGFRSCKGCQSTR